MDTFRKHEEYHIRRLEQQMLDALLRIEEILANRGDHGPADGDIEDVITKVVPTETPFSNKAGGLTKVKRR